MLRSDVHFHGTTTYSLSHIFNCHQNDIYYRDTVDSVGIIPRRLPFTTSNTIVRTFRHAVALDERRAKFKANLWNRPNTKEQTLSVTDQEVHTAKKTGETDHHHEGVGRTSRKHSQHILERAYSKDPTQPTDVEEVSERSLPCSDC